MVRLLAWVTPVGYLTVTKVGATRDVNGGGVVGVHVLPLQWGNWGQSSGNTQRVGTTLTDPVVLAGTGTQNFFHHQSLTINYLSSEPEAGDRFDNF